MKRKIAILMVSFVILLQLVTPIHAMSENQSAAIQSLLDDACRISGVPGMSVSIIDGSDIQYFSSGYANIENKYLTDENTLYELASVSKAYSALGILLLEQKGMLHLTDSIQEYLPWLTLQYEGNPVDMSKVTLGNFLYHTSGLTNAMHTQLIPEGDTPDMLHKTVECLINAELEFYPGELYTYGTVNYDILGLVLEVITDQSYENFMIEEIFHPLGLYQTYAFAEEASSTMQMAQGYRSTFLMTKPYNSPPVRGNKPAGYLISSAYDMARWMQIQLGLLDDIPEDLSLAILKSHEADKSVPAVDYMYYAGGWAVNQSQSIIEHSGNNPNFTTQVILFPKEQIGISLLSNSNTTNIELVYNIKDILNGNLSQTYHMGIMRLIDLTLTIITIIGCVLTIIFILSRLRRKRNTQQQKTRSRIVLTKSFFIITILLLFLCIFFPKMTGMDWSMLLSWQPSILTAFLSLFLLSASITWRLR